MHELLEKAGKNIKHYRLQKGISQEKLEYETGIAISHCESGKRNITLSTLGILSKHLNIEPWQLLK